MLSVLTQFLKNLSKLVAVDGSQSNLVNVVSGVPHGLVFPLLFLLYTSKLFSLPENKRCFYADNSTLVGVMLFLID